jgi:predicted amidohydrolase
MPASAPSLRIALHQLDLAWNLPDVNLASMERAWKSAPGADVHVFPEMVATGFLTGADELARVEAQADGSPYTAQWKSWAAQSDAVILASLVVRLPDADFRFANRLFAVFPDGQVQTADKMHLFGLAGEDAHFVAGNHPCVSPGRVGRPWRPFATTCVFRNRPAIPGTRTIRARNTTSCVIWPIGPTVELPIGTPCCQHGPLKIRRLL